MITSRLPRVIAAALSATLLAACGDIDAPTAPTTRLTPQGVLGAAPSFSIDGTDLTLYRRGDTTVAYFKVKPDEAETYVWDGKNAISFPVGGICEPETSGYGAGTWDEPCSPTRREITIKLKSYYGPDGNARVDFTPALRFNPASAGVFLYLDPDDTEDSSGRALDPWFKSIYYCTDLGVCVDEALTDPSLQTFYDSRTDLLGRRIKHFSGYGVSVGFAAAF